MFGALKRGFRSMASLILVRNVVGELQPKRTLAALRGFLAAARLSCYSGYCCKPYCVGHKIEADKLGFSFWPILLFIMSIE